MSGTLKHIKKSVAQAGTSLVRTADHIPPKSRGQLRSKAWRSSIAIQAAEQMMKLSAEQMLAHSTHPYDQGLLKQIQQYDRRTPRQITSLTPWENQMTTKEAIEVVRKMQIEDAKRAKLAFAVSKAVMEAAVEGVNPERKRMAAGQAEIKQSKAGLVLIGKIEKLCDQLIAMLER